VGWLSESGTISLPRIEPLFASAYGVATVLFAALGVSLRLLVTFFAVVKPVPSRKHAKTAQEYRKHIPYQDFSMPADDASTQPSSGQPEQCGKEPPISKRLNLPQLLHA